MEIIAYPMRTVIRVTLVACVLVAIAPWWSGGQEPLALLLSGGVLLLGALLAWRQPAVRQLRRGPLVVSWAVLMAWAGASWLWSAGRYSTELWVTQWLLAGLAFRLAYTVAAEKQGRQWLLWGYLASAVGFCLVAIVMYLTSSYERLTGTFYWANPAAAYLIPALVLVVDNLRRSWGKTTWLWSAIGVLFGATFLLANSRAALLVVALTLALYLLVVPTVRRFWITLVFIIVTSVALSFGLVSMSTLFVHKSNTEAPGARVVQLGESHSFRDRLSYMSSALEMWFAHSLAGTGAGTYGDVHPQYQKHVVGASTNAHNVYLQVLAELGIVGAVALAAVLLWLLMGTLRGVVASPEMVPVVLGLAGLLLHFGLDVDASFPSLLMLAAVLFGAVYQQWWPAWGRASWRWPAVAALLLVPLVSLYRSDSWATRAQAAQDDGDYPAAATLYGEAEQGVVANPDYVNAEGIALYAAAASGGRDSNTAAALALDRAHRAQRLDPHDGQHHQLEGRVLMLRGDFRGAQTAFRRALQLDPLNHPDYALDLAVVQLRAGDPSGARQTAQAMVALYPRSVVASRNLDQTLGPTMADLEAVVGNADLQQGKLREAGVAADRALQYDPHSLQGRALKVQVGKLTKP